VEVNAFLRHSSNFWIYQWYLYISRVYCWLLQVLNCDICRLRSWSLSPKTMNAIFQITKSSSSSFPSNANSFSSNNTPPTAFYSYLIFSVIASSFHTFLLWVNGRRPLNLWLYLALSEKLVFIVENKIWVVFLNTIVIRSCFSFVFAFMNCF